MSARSILQMLPLLVAPGLLGSCAVAGAAVDIVTLPVKAVGAGVDLATTSQEEADRNRGRQIREREEQLGRLAEERDEAAEDCLDRNEIAACDRMRELDWQMEKLQAAPLN